MQRALNKYTFQNFLFDTLYKNSTAKYRHIEFQRAEC